MSLFAIFPKSTKTIVAWNTVSQLIGKTINAGATFFISILIARAYGANGYGDFVKITSYIAFFYLFADFGLNAIYLQKNSQVKTEADSNLWGSLLSIRFLGGVFLIFLALALLSFLPQGVGQGYTPLVRLGIILFSPTILIQGIITTTNAVFQKRLRYDRSSLAIVLGSFISVVFVLLVISGVPPLLGPIFSSLAVLVGVLFTAVASIIFVRRLEKYTTVSFNKSTMRSLFIASLPLGLTLLFNQVYFRIDSFVLVLTRATAEVGYYGLAYKVFEVALVAPTFFMNAIYPFMLTPKNNDTENQKMVRIKTFFFKALTVLVVASFVCLGIIWYGAPLLTIVRPEFYSSVSALRVLVLGLPLFFLSSLTMWTLIASKKQNFLVLIYGSSMILTTILDIVFIPERGFMAAAWITVFSEGLVLLMSSLILYRMFTKKYL